MEEIKPYLDRHPELLESLAQATAPTREEVLEGLDDVRSIVRVHVEDESRNDVNRPWTMALERLNRAIAYLEAQPARPSPAQIFKAIGAAGFWDAADQWGTDDLAEISPVDRDAFLTALEGISE